MVRRASLSTRNLSSFRIGDDPPAPTGRAQGGVARRSGARIVTEAVADDQASAQERHRRALAAQASPVIMLGIGCGLMHVAMPWLMPAWLPRFALEFFSCMLLMPVLHQSGLLLHRYLHPPPRVPPPAPPGQTAPASNRQRPAARPARGATPAAAPPSPRAAAPWLRLQAARAQGSRLEMQACAWQIVGSGESISQAQLRMLLALPGLFQGERGMDLAPALARRCRPGLALQLYTNVAMAAVVGDLPRGLGLWACQAGIRNNRYRLPLYLAQANLERQAGRLDLAARVLQQAPRWLRCLLQDWSTLKLQQALLSSERVLLLAPAAAADAPADRRPELRRVLDLAWRLGAQRQDVALLASLQAACQDLEMAGPDGPASAQLMHWLQQIGARPAVRPAAPPRPRPLPRRASAPALGAVAPAPQPEVLLGANWTGLAAGRSACGQRARWFQAPELLMQWRWRRLPPRHYVAPPNIRPARPREVLAMQAALARACSGRHDALAFMARLRHSRGPQAFGVATPPEYVCVTGGMVRDVLRATAAELPAGVAAPVPQDADILHTQVPADAMLLANALTADVRGSAGEPNGLASSWASLMLGHCAYDSGSASDAPGVDLVSTRSDLGAYEPRQRVEGNIDEGVWPLAFGTSDMREDARLRCAHLNAVAYFPEDRVFVDYTGEGIADARHWRWRCGSAMLLRNRSYLSRFYQGVGQQGCSTDDATRRNIARNAEYFARQDSDAWAQEVARAARCGPARQEPAAARLDRLEQFFMDQGMPDVARDCIRTARAAAQVLLQAAPSARP